MASASADLSYPKKIVPRFAWTFQWLGALAAIAVLVLSFVVTSNGFFWLVMPLVCMVYLLVTIVLCVRPPGILLYADHMIVRQLRRNRRIARHDVRSVFLQLPKRVIGTEAPNSRYRHVEIAIWLEGREYVIPMIWCDRLLGVLTPKEAQSAKSTIEGWIRSDHAPD